MGLPPYRNSVRSRFTPRCAPFLVFLALVAVLVLFNVDILIAQTKVVSRNNIESSSSNTYNIEQNRGTFGKYILVTWGDEHANIVEEGELLTLSLDKSSGSGFQSRKQYLFGKIQMQIKLIPGNAAGTVTTYYLSSEGSEHDEIDFEFLGNVSGEPYTLHTNVFSKGKGDREQQFHLWFDPTADFHTYTILWNPQRIIFYVDDTAIREYKNAEKLGVPYPKNQAMRMYSSLWNADDWATRGGRVKTDWAMAPFVASYRNYTANACIWFAGQSSCDSPEANSTAHPWLTEGLDFKGREKLRWVQRYHMVYNYCTDTFRFPKPPPECKL